MAVLLLLLFASLPLGSAIQFGGDEGYELMKAYLQTRGFPLYREIWSDQPPVFTLLLDWAFRLFGVSALAARSVTAGFTLLLFLCLYQMVRARLGALAAWFAAFFLLAAPVVLEISVSAMQEVPALAMGMLSAGLLFQWARRPHSCWLWASGAAMGVALEIKFIVALMVPAMLVELALLTQANHGPAWRRKAFVSLFQWSLAALLMFGAIGWIWGQGSLQASLSAHFGTPAPALTDIGGERPDDFALSPALFLQHADATLPALAGLLLALWRRQFRASAFPLIWLLTALAVHSAHRPWWPYYYLHFAIPIAWLAGSAAGEMVGVVSMLLKGFRFNLGATSTWRTLLLCGLIALPLARSLSRLELNVRDLRQRPRVEASAIIAKMKERASATHWAYADNPVYVFHAGLTTPPGLAVVTLKRFWSGQITTAGIVETCRRFQVEQILLGPVSRQDTNWTNLLAERCRVEGEERYLQLFVTGKLDAE